MLNIYDELKAKNVQIDNHESDLYCPVNETTKTIIGQYDHKSNITTFKNQIDGKLWYDIPFAYTPWWNTKEVK